MSHVHPPAHVSLAGGPGVSSAASASERRLWIVLGLTTGVMLLEAAGGLLTRSLALLADAGHMLTDVAGLVLALAAIRFARRPATQDRTYGYYRVEILAALSNAVLLIGISFFILYEAYQRFVEPPEVASGMMMIIAAIGLGTNLAGMKLMRAGAETSLNLKGAYYELLADMVSSLGVLIAGAVMWATSWYYADPLISAGIGLLILPRTWSLLRDVVGVLLEGTPSDVNLAAVRESLAEEPTILAVHDLHVWTLTSGVNAMSVHVVRTDAATHDEVLVLVQRKIKSTFNIAHVTAQVESRGCAAGETHL